MNQILLLSAFAPASIRFERSWNILANSGADPKNIADGLRPHLDALERAHASLSGNDERVTVLAFMEMWEVQKNIPSTFIGLMEATCHRWLMDPPTVARARRLAKERRARVVDEHATVHHPWCGHVTPNGSVDTPCERCVPPVVAQDDEGGLAPPRHQKAGQTMPEQILVCYREACTANAHVSGYNRVTHGLYCLPCAVKIHSASPELNLHPLLKHRTSVASGGQYRAGRIAIRPQPETPTT